MKKLVWIVLLLIVIKILIVFLLTRLNNILASPEKSEPSTYPPIVDYVAYFDTVEMTVIYATYSHIEIKITNNSSYNISTGEDFILLKYIDGEWKQVQGLDSLFFHLTLIVIPPKESLSIVKDLTTNFLPLEEGIYCIIKSINLSVVPEMENYWKIYELVDPYLVELSNDWGSHDLIAIFTLLE